MYSIILPCIVLLLFYMISLTVIFKDAKVLENKKSINA